MISALSLSSSLRVCLGALVICKHLIPFQKVVARTNLLCRWGCSSQRCMLSWHSLRNGHSTASLSSRLRTSRLEARHCCSWSLWRSTGQKSWSCRKLLRHWKQYVCPHGVSMGCNRGCRQMWHTSSSSTSSWYSNRWLSWPSWHCPHSLHTRAHVMPPASGAALGSIMAWRC